MDEPEVIDRVRAWLGPGAINIFGPPFAGKDTQGQRLAKALDAQLLGGGDILRGSDIPNSVKSLMRAGELIPTNDYFELVLPYLKQPEFTGIPLILSSVGRWHGEEAGVLEATSAAGHPLRAVFYLNIDEPVVWERWERSDSRRSRGKRADDSYEVLQIRLEEFRRKTLPVIEFYRSQKLLIEIDSNRPTDIVSKDILDRLLQFSESRDQSIT